MDVLPAGEERQIPLFNPAKGLKEEFDYYPSHESIDFITVMKKILNYLQKWVIKC